MLLFELAAERLSSEVKPATLGITNISVVFGVVRYRTADVTLTHVSRSSCLLMKSQFHVEFDLKSDHLWWTFVIFSGLFCFWESNCCWFECVEQLLLLRPAGSHTASTPTPSLCEADVGISAHCFSLGTLLSMLFFLIIALGNGATNTRRRTVTFLPDDAKQCGRNSVKVAFKDCLIDGNKYIYKYIPKIMMVAAWI